MPKTTLWRQRSLMPPFLLFSKITKIAENLSPTGSDCFTHAAQSCWKKAWMFLVKILKQTFQIKHLCNLFLFPQLPRKSNLHFFFSSEIWTLYICLFVCKALPRKFIFRCICTGEWSTQIQFCYRRQRKQLTARWLPFFTFCLKRWS